MKPFGYLMPESLGEACSLLSRHKEKAKVIAGGQSLIPQLTQNVIAPEYVIDVKNLSDLAYIKEGTDSLTIGALTTHRAIETSPVIAQKFPMLVEMERRLADVQIRNWGTIGGNLCHADPGGDPAPGLIALGAIARTRTARGQREIKLERFFLDFLTTVLRPDEILTEIEIPYLPPDSAGAYRKESVRPNDLGIASAAVVVSMDPGHEKVKTARIVLGGVGSTPFRARHAERLMAGKKVNAEMLTQVGAAAAAESSPTSDIHGSEWYKRQIVAVVTREMAEMAIKRART